MSKQKSYSSLTGRESLIRIIGKRRHFLPNLPRLLSSSRPPRSCVDLFDVGERESTSTTEIKPKTIIVDNDDTKNNKVGVLCPVCECDVPGGQHSINSHLDTCLNQTKKRKRLTQSTLLQLNFCLKSEDQVVEEQSQVFESNVFSDNSNKESFHTGDEEVDVIVGEVSGGKDCLLPSNIGLFDLGLNENAMSPEITDPNIRKPLLTENGEGPADCEVKISLDRICGVTLESFIVGRKFSDCKEVDFGKRICLQREPSNLKDSNAIQVVSADLENRMIFGYLPRELAHHLSPLMDKYCMEFEMFIFRQVSL